MRLAFMGSPGFAVPALRALHAAGHEIAAVYCQPPRPAGRGQATRPSPVQTAAEALGLAVRTPARLRRETAEHEAFAALRLDAAVVAAYGLLLPPAILDAPARGCLNIHASLLPRWRGASPIQAALLAGDRETGISIMRMDAGLDTGPVLLQEHVPLGPETTAAALHDTLAALGARAILRALDTWPHPHPQPEEGVTHAPKLTRADGEIDWRLPAPDIARRVRALNPWPGTWTSWEGERIKILEAAPADGEGAVSCVLDKAFTVGCGAGVLRVLRVQREGRPPLAAGDALRGMRAVPPFALGN